MERDNLTGSFSSVSGDDLANIPCGGPKRSLENPNGLPAFRSSLKRFSEQLAVVSLAGTWREMGLQYGELLAGEIRETLDWANRCGNDTSDSFFSPGGIPSGMDFMDEFIAGVSSGTGIGVKDLIRANGVEVAYGNQLTDLLQKGGKCGALILAPSRTESKQLIFCRNYDWLPSFADLTLVVAILHPADGEPLLSINFAGCYYLTTGMNAKGLFIELNSGLFACEQMDLTRRQNAWELWRILRRSSNVPQAVAELSETPAAAYYLIGLGDSERAALFEWAVNGDSATLPPSASTGALAFTNHFIRPGWVNGPLADLGGSASSKSRRRALCSLEEQLPREATIDDIQNLLSVEVDQGGAKWTGTLFQIIAIPAERKILLRHQRENKWFELVL